MAAPEQEGRVRAPTEFDIYYADALEILLQQDASENKRTGAKVKAAHGFTFYTSPTCLPLLTLRDIKPLWACAEAVWFMSGKSDSAFMKKFGFKVWDKFADESGHVASATGHRWREHFKVDQLKDLIGKLSLDKTNRQGVLVSWDPVEDTLRPGKNVPCVDMWHFHVINDMLHMSVLQRSGDMYFGVPHDIFGSRLVQLFLSAGLGVKPGAISYTISNAHLYEDQWPAAREMITRLKEMRRKGASIKYPKDIRVTRDEFLSAMVGDDTLPLKIAERVAKIYDPWPNILGPKLVS